MAYLINKISNFKFIAIAGAVDESAVAISIDSWAGVDGVDFTDEGRKGVPFSLFTLVDTDDLAEATERIRDYKELTASGSVEIVQDGEIILERFKVLAVTPLRKQKIAVAVGNKQSTLAGALLECRWDLIAQPIL